MNKKVAIMIIAIIIVLALSGAIVVGAAQNMTNEIDHPMAAIKIEGYEKPITVKLYPEYAPNTVRNFIALANSGFYNGLIIHRVEKGFVIQTGDPKGDGNGGPTMSAIDDSITKDSESDVEYEINRRIFKKWI